MAKPSAFKQRYADGTCTYHIGIEHPFWKMVFISKSGKPHLWGPGVLKEITPSMAALYITGDASPIF